MRMNKDGLFKIMQITDMQEIPKVSPDTMALLDAAIEDEKPDLVVYTGDQIKGYGVSYKGKGKELENAVAKTINTLLEPVTKRNIPFAVTFGNHDRQVGISNKDQFNDIYKALPNCIGTQAEGIDGGGTYNIPIKASDGSDRDAFNLYLFDSGTDAKGGGYEAFDKKIISWYKAKRDELKEKNGKYVPSIVFQHIPLPEYYCILRRVKKNERKAVQAYRYKFSSIKEVLAKANEQKSGDSLAGIAAANAKERIAAKEVLSDLTVEEITAEPAVPANEDAVTRIILGDLDTKEYDKIKSLTIGELREAILDNMISGDEILKKARGMTSEVIAALAKLMGNLDLMYVSRKLHIEATCNTTIGKKGTFAVRLQPNHPTDNVKGVTASLLEGLSYGAGDAVLGLNPAIDNVKSTTDILNLFNDVKSRLKIPTQICVLSHITTQLKALKSGAPMDLCFQSIAGSEKALASFGTDVDMLAEANELMASKGTSIGPNYMYFETRQGSELSSNSHNGADQLVMESRCYGLARHYNPFLVNTVVGFIGPEYIYDTKELIRAALEDNFCGHMHGLPMGCDICYTNHMKADQNDSDSLLVMLASAGCHYVMSIPQSDDVMLMYQSTSYHDIAAIREMLGLSPIEEFKQWLEGYGIWENGHLGKNAGNPRIFL